MHHRTCPSFVSRTPYGRNFVWLHDAGEAVVDMSLEYLGFLLPIVALVVTVVMGVCALLVSVLALVVAVVMNLLGHQPKRPGGSPVRIAPWDR